MILRFLEGIIVEHIDMKSSLDSKLQIGYIRSIRICSRNEDIVEKPRQLKFNHFDYLLSKVIYSLEI